jgi:hypothetical protein
MEPPNWRNHIALKRCPELLGQIRLAREGGIEFNMEGD